MYVWKHNLSSPLNLKIFKNAHLYGWYGWESLSYRYQFLIYLRTSVRNPLQITTITHPPPCLRSLPSFLSPPPSVSTSCWWRSIWSRSVRPRSSRGLWPGSTRRSQPRIARTSGGPAGPRRRRWTRTAVAAETSREQEIHYVSVHPPQLLLLLQKTDTWWRISQCLELRVLASKQQMYRKEKYQRLTHLSKCL